MAKAKSTKAAAKKPATKKPATKVAPVKAVKVKAAKVVLTPDELEAKKIAKSVATLAKYGDKIVAGSVRRAPVGSIYGQKMLVTINTRGMDGEFDGNTREVATSDVHQVHHTEEVDKELSKQRDAEKRAAKRAAKVEVAVDLDALEASL